MSRAYAFILEVERFLFRNAFRTKKLLAIMAIKSFRRQLMRHRIAAAVEHIPVLAQLHGCSTVLDVGANRGQFSLVARHCHPSASIEAFEPLPAPALLLKRAFAADEMIRVHRVAIGPRSERMPIHVSGRDDSSSLLPITATQVQLFPGTGEVGTQEVQVGTLDQFVDPARIRAPALLKLDVQGFELQALAGCESILPRLSWVYAECTFVELYTGQVLADELINWLRDRGFRLRGVYHMAHDPRGQAIQADFLFGR